MGQIVAKVFILTGLVGKARESGSWSWTVVPGKLVKDHCKDVEQAFSPFSQDLGAEGTLGPSLFF